MHEIWTVPCFFNASYLLIQINEFNQLFLQNSLSAQNLFDEHVVEQVDHIWPQLKILNQTPEEETGEEINECLLYSSGCVLSAEKLYLLFRGITNPLASALTCR